MIEKNSNQHSAISIQKSSFQPSALSPQLFPEPSASCRIVCDETREHFRLILCRTLCAGFCPEHKESMGKEFDGTPSSTKRKPWLTESEGLTAKSCEP